MIFNLPLTLIKAEQDTERTAKIRGVISTDSEDMQGERVSQEGLDFSYFLKKGWFNYEHQRGAENLLGYPTGIKREGNQTTVEGVLLLDVPKAREIYEMARALRKATKNRSLGFSVEGQVLERDPLDSRKVIKARVLNVAITGSPVNSDTSLELLKSLFKTLGYQSPSIPSSESLSALVPQNLAPNLANASSEALDQNIAPYLDFLRRSFPALGPHELSAYALRLFEDHQHEQTTDPDASGASRDSSRAG